jgi:signal transduction histidine kinase
LELSSRTCDRNEPARPSVLTDSMKLRARLIVTSLLAAIPVTILLFEVNEWLRARDMTEALRRFVASQMTDDFRERCESNPNWFIAGPREDRPRPEVLAAPDADVTAPRPPTTEHPVEFFAYDDSFSALSSAAPRFPTELRQALRTGTRVISEAFVTRAGAGVQEALLTDWSRSPCVALLFRMRPLPNQTSESVAIVTVLALLLVGVALVAGGPVVWRMRRLGIQARQSASEEYRSTVDVGGRDEMSALAFAFNEAASDIRRRATDTRDREDSLRRYIASTTDSVTKPLADLERRLGRIDSTGVPVHVLADIRGAVADAHTLAMRMQNLAVAATLRMTIASPAKDVVDLNALLARAASRQEAFARSAGVQLTIAPGAPPVSVAGDLPLLEQAVNNLVDNAIRYNRDGGEVIVALDKTRDGRFSLRVTDNGPGAPDEVLARLNANRRFRGDEGRSGGSGELGLGLAIVREVGDRFGIRWAFRRSTTGWFEAELTGEMRTVS